MVSSALWTKCDINNLKRRLESNLFQLENSDATICTGPICISWQVERSPNLTCCNNCMQFDTTNRRSVGRSSIVSSELRVSTKLRRCISISDFFLHRRPTQPLWPARYCTQPLVFRAQMEENASDGWWRGRQMFSSETWRKNVSWHWRQHSGSYIGIYYGNIPL